MGCCLIQVAKKFKIICTHLKYPLIKLQLTKVLLAVSKESTRTVSPVPYIIKQTRPEYTNSNRARREQELVKRNLLLGKINERDLTHNYF